MSGRCGVQQVNEIRAYDVSTENETQDEALEIENPYAVWVNKNKGWNNRCTKELGKFVGL